MQFTFADSVELQVPSYLQTRKAELAQQHADAQVKKLADLVPPGMRIMPEEARLEMLGPHPPPCYLVRAVMDARD